MEQLVSGGGYLIDPTAISTLVTATAILLLGLLVLVRERISAVSIPFFTMTVVVAVWLFGFSGVYASTNEEDALWWSRVAYLGVPFIAPATHHFTTVVLKIYERYKLLVWAGWMAAFIFSAAALGTNTLIDGVYLYEWGYYTRFGWLGAPFIAYFFALLATNMVYFRREYRLAPPGTHKRRISGLMLAFAVGYVGVVDFVAVYGVPLYPFGYLAILGFIILAAKAIWTYRLVDITPAFAARQIINTMTDGLLVLDREGVVRLANRAATRLLGFSEYDLLRKPLAETIGRTLFGEQLSRLEEEGTIASYETAYLNKGGETRYLSLSASAMRDRNNNLVATVCIARDITAQRLAEQEIRRLNEGLEQRVAERTEQLQKTNEELEREVLERKRIEQALRESEGRYRTLVEQASDGIIVLDETGNFIEANSRACEMVGYEREELLKLNVEDIISAGDLATTPIRYEELRTGKAVMSEREIRRSDGTLFSAEISSKMLDDGRLQAIVRDITERKAYEKKLEEDATFQAHLLNQLMTAQEAERRRLSMDIHDGPLQSLGVALLAIDRTIRRFERNEYDIVDRELQSLRTSLAGTVGELRDVLADLSQEVLSTYGLAIALQSHIERFVDVTGIEVEMRNAVNSRLPADIELLMYRLAQEALANVRKHSQAHRASVALESVNGSIHLVVSDNGRGFDVNQMLNNYSDGKRLGLRSMRQRVKAAGGDMRVTSTDNGGTTLEFWCPVTKKTTGPLKPSRT